MKHGDFIIIDLLFLQICYVLTYWIFHGVSSPYSDDTFQYLALLMFLGQVLVILFSSHYRSILRRNGINELISDFVYCAEILVLTLVFLFMVKRSSEFSRLQIFVTTGMFWLVDFVVKQLRKKQVIRALKRSKNNKKLVLVTSREHVEEALKKLTQTETKNVEIVAIALMGEEKEEPDPIPNVNVACPVFRLSDQTLEWISHEWVDGVFVLQPMDQLYPAEFMNGLVTMGITMYHSLSVFNDGSWPAVDFQKLGEYKVITTSVKFISAGWLMMKRLMDILGGLVGCIFTLLLTIIIGPMIYFKDPGKIFFTQERIGRNGRPFKIYKFRTMYKDAEERKAALMEQNKMNGLMFKMDDDPRIIGSEKKDKNGKPKGIGNFLRRTSLDEFPQFLNVLIGNMSLVGWRPCTMNEWKEYGLEHRSRAGMKPGITGMWQVSGRSEITDFDEVVRLDQEYIENWSLLLDIKILFKTVGVVLMGKGAE